MTEQEQAERVGHTDANARIYPCKRCGTLRSKNEGGTCFTVCDECWDALAALSKATQGGGR